MLFNDFIEFQYDCALANYDILLLKCDAYTRPYSCFTDALTRYNGAKSSCSSSTGCPCTLSAMIANTWTIVTDNSNRICDSHNFHNECYNRSYGENGDISTATCDGSHCDLYGVPTITGTMQNDAQHGDQLSCICRAAYTHTLTAEFIEHDVWSSSCVENTYDSATLPSGGFCLN